MARLSLFNSPLLLGFDHFERALDRVSKVSSDGYPPYNIEQVSENSLRITLAVAGFAMGDLKLTIEALHNIPQELKLPTDCFPVSVFNLRTI